MQKGQFLSVICVWWKFWELDISVKMMWSSADTFWGKGFLATGSRNSKPRPQKDLKRTRQGPGNQLRIYLNRERREGKGGRENEKWISAFFHLDIFLINNNEHTYLSWSNSLTIWNQQRFEFKLLQLHTVINYSITQNEHHCVVSCALCVLSRLNGQKMVFSVDHVLHLWRAA